VALPQKQSPEIVLYKPPGCAGEGEESTAPVISDEILPDCDVIGGAGVESGGVGHADVEVVPRIPLDEQTRDVTHLG
ncbi:hypothetical protein PSY31_24085, partial [Shigella flexneri]|nr:hypothetical protein [Shigella flexneri]